MFYPADSAVPRGTLEIKKHLLNLPPKPFRHPATVYSSFHLWPRGRTHSSQRVKPGKGSYKWLRPLSASLFHESPPPPHRKNLELSELHNSPTFNQNHKQSREELCHLMNTVQVNTDWSEDLTHPLRMIHLHTHTLKWLLTCRRIPLLLYPVLDDWQEQEKTTTDRIMTKQVAIYVLHWRSYWYNDYSLLYVRGASDKLTNWLVNCSVSWPNRKPAVPFCYWFPPPWRPAPKRRSRRSPFPRAHWIGWFAPQGWELEG